MTIYIVVRGEYGEGYTIVATYANKEAADAHVTAIQNEFGFADGCDFTKVVEQEIL